MDENLKLVLTLIGGGGGTAFLALMFKGIANLWTGAAQREQSRNTSLAKQRTDAISERDEANKERDAADDKRREAEEHVAILKRQIILLGAEPIKYGTEKENDG